MTVLSEFTKLESIGLWRAAPGAPRREVIVCLGDATLMIADGNGSPLTHWSLPAVQRINPRDRPALFAPTIDGDETLELDDDLMIDAMEKVSKTVRRRQRAPGRLRPFILAGLAIGALGFGAAWLPDALIRQAQSVVPEVKRAMIGNALLAQMEPLIGQACDSDLGTAALNSLHRRALGMGARGRTVIVPSGVQTSLLLPGGIIVLNRSVVENTEDPAVIAGYIIATAALAQQSDPFGDVLRNSGLRTTLALLTTGEIAQDTLARYGEVLATSPLKTVPSQSLVALFATAQVPFAPYADTLGTLGAAGLVEANAPPRDTFPPLLSDADWISLQGICD